MIELRPNRTAGGVIANFTEACMPIQDVVFNLRTNNGVAVVRVDQLGNVIWESSGVSSVAEPVADWKNTKVVVSLDPIAFNSNNHMRGTLGLNKRCVSGRYEGFDMPCFQTTWRDVMHRWPSKMIRSVFHDICWAGDDPIMQCREGILGTLPVGKLQPCTSPNPDKAQVAEPLNFVDPFRVATICKTLKTCIEAVAYWGKAPSWQGECLVQASDWLKNETRNKPIPDPPKTPSKPPPNLSDPKWQRNHDLEKEVGLAGHDVQWKQEAFALLQNVTQTANASIKDDVARCGAKT